MFLGRLNKFLRKYQKILTYVTIVIALNLLLKLFYDEIYVQHENPLILIILISILVICTMASYSNRKQHMLANFILESSDFINLYAVDLNYRFIAVNHNDIRLVEELFDFTPRIGDYPMKYLNKERAALFKANIDRAKSGETFTFLDELDREGKKSYWENLYSPIYSYTGKIIGTFCIVLDVTEQVTAEIERERLIYEDTLTKVYNRRYIELAFEECVVNKQDEITVIISDLDKFKEANDTLGHAVGDKILVEFGNILTKIMPQDAVVARLGGDEFAVLLPGVSEKQAKFLINLVEVEVSISDIPVTVSLGAYTGSYKSHKKFIDFCSLADEKMYVNKNQKG